MLCSRFCGPGYAPVNVRVRVCTLCVAENVLTRFDIGFDLPERFMAAFPPAMYLVQRPDLGDVLKGKLGPLLN